VATPELTVLMPAYNEAGALAASVSAVRAALDALGVVAEVLVVDDASVDGTGAVAEALAAADPGVRVVHHPANRGIGGGFVTGVAEAAGRWMILIPADLAMDLGELPKYLAAASAGADIVVGVRSDRRDYSPFRRLVSWLNIRSIQLLFGLDLRQFNYISLYRVAVLRALDITYWHSAFFFAEVLIKARDRGCRLVEVDVRYVPRASGRATGANRRLIADTGRDMLRYWWLRRHSVAPSVGALPGGGPDDGS
jgi:glycosyltransferase involved in cell wall biosynthesis